MGDLRPNPPRRTYGDNLPPDAYRAIGVAKVANRPVADEETLRYLLNKLRSWKR